MRNTFIFNGRRCDDFGLFIENLPDSAHSERRGESYQIAGRNGTQYREDGTFENYDQIYKVGIRNFTSRYDVYKLTGGIANWLLGSSGFCRLEDSYNPEVYRLARFSGPLNVQAIMRSIGRGTLIFECQPEMYLKSGEKAIAIDTTQLHNVLENPTGQIAKPLFKIKGSSGLFSFSINNDPNEVFPGNAYTVDLSLRPNVAIYIDSDSYEIYYEDGRNAAAALATNLYGYHELPTLQAWNDILVSQPASADTFEITPRWWTL